jgi:hypothetical protein
LTYLSHLVAFICYSIGDWIVHSLGGSVIAFIVIVVEVRLGLLGLNSIVAGHTASGFDLFLGEVLDVGHGELTEQSCLRVVCADQVSKGTC